MDNYSHFVISREARPFMAVCMDSSVTAGIGERESATETFLATFPQKG